MADAAENQDIITLVTSNDPPVELRVERTKLLDSSVFSDMLSLPSTGDCKARVDVSETAAELEAWIEFLNSGKLETPQKISDDDEVVLGRKVVTIAKLVDKYACTFSRHLLIAELWRVLVERRYHPLFVVLASDHVQADHVQRHAAAEVLALRISKGRHRERECIGFELLKQWNIRFDKWQALLIPERTCLIFENSDDKLYGSCKKCNRDYADIWREILLSAGRKEAPIGSFIRAAQSGKTPCHSRHDDPLQLRDAAYELESEMRRALPAFPPQ